MLRDISRRMMITEKHLGPSFEDCVEASCISRHANIKGRNTVPCYGLVCNAPKQLRVTFNACNTLRVWPRVDLPHLQEREDAIGISVKQVKIGHKSLGL